VAARDVNLLGPGGVASMAQCCGYALLANMDNNDGLWVPAFLAKLRRAAVACVPGLDESPPVVFALSVRERRMAACRHLSAATAKSPAASK